MLPYLFPQDLYSRRGGWWGDNFTSGMGQRNHTYIQPHECYLVPEESIFPNPQCWSSQPPPSAGPRPLLPPAAQPINPVPAASSPIVSFPLKPHPGAGYWSGSCPIDLILSSESWSERGMGFAFCFSLLHDWVCATDDTWHCPFPA